MTPQPFLVVCHRFPGNELIAAECKQLTAGSMQADGFAVCSDIQPVKRSAYIRFGASLLAHADSIESMLDQIDSLEIDATDFCIENYRLPGASRAESMSQARIAIADRLSFYPNIDHPLHRFVLILRADGWWFGEIIILPDSSWKIHDAKPYRTSSSLSARLARGLVNLAGIKSNQVVVNPCCGTGSLMLESAAMNAIVVGSDWNKRMVGMTNRNLAYFNYPFKAVWADARSWDSEGDVLLADLPYNRALISRPDNTEAILEHAISLAPRAVFIAGEDLQASIERAGWKVDGSYRVSSSSGFARFIFQVHDPRGSLTDKESSG